MGHHARQDQANPNGSFGSRVGSRLSFSGSERSQVFLGSRPRLRAGERNGAQVQEEIRTGTWWGHRPRSLSIALAAYLLLLI